MSTIHERATERVGTAPTGTPAGIDPRSPQLAAALTAVVLAAVLLLAPHPVGIALLGVQTLLFAIGAVAGVQRTPHAWLFRTLVRPRLAPPTELEDPAPPRFAQIGMPNTPPTRPITKDMSTISMKLAGMDATTLRGRRDRLRSAWATGDATTVAKDAENASARGASANG